MINIWFLYNFFECGHFCLRYIFKKEKINYRVRYNKVFMSLLEIKKVLLNVFNKCECYYVSSLDYVSKRCISVLRYKSMLHYIVIERVDSEYVYYYDPAFIRLRRKRINKFLNRWEKIVCYYG